MFEADVDVSGVLSSLAQTRHFLLEHELVSDVGHCGDVQVPVLSQSGEHLGTQNVQAAAAEGRLNALVEFAQPQDAEERADFLEALEQSEAQLLGWLLVHTQVGLLVSDDEGDEEVLRQLQETVTQWEQWLLSSEGDLVSVSYALCDVFERADLSRKQRNQMVRHGLEIWRANVEIQGTTADCAIAHWTKVIGEIRAQLVEKNIRLVTKHCAHARRLTFEENLKAGLIGFGRALDFFEVRQGHQLSTYATWWIKQAIHRNAANHGSPVRVPVHHQELVSKLRARWHRQWRPGKSPQATLHEVCQELGVNLHKACRDLMLAERTIPTTRRSAITSLTIEETLFDPISEPSLTMPTVEFFGHAMALLQTVMDKHRNKTTRTPGQIQRRNRSHEILVRRLGYQQPKRHTLEQIGREYDLTRERIRQLESMVFEYLRSACENELADLMATIRRSSSDG